MEDYWSLGHQVQGGQYGVLKTNPGTVVHVCNLTLILLSGQKQKDDELEVSLGFRLLFQPRKVRNGERGRIISKN